MRSASAAAPGFHFNDGAMRAMAAAMWTMMMPRIAESQACRSPDRKPGDAAEREQQAYRGECRKFCTSPHAPHHPCPDCNPRAARASCRPYPSRLSSLGPGLAHAKGGRNRRRRVGRQGCARHRLPADLHRLRGRDRRAAQLVRRAAGPDALHRAALSASASARPSRSISACRSCRRPRIADPPVFERARAAARYDDVARASGPPAEIRRPARARPRARAP